MRNMWQLLPHPSTEGPERTTLRLVMLPNYR